MTVLPSTAVRLFAHAAALQASGRLPSLVAGVVRDGALAWSCGHGAMTGTEVPPGDNLQYRIGSISKTLTAVAVMQLRDAGRLALDDPVDKHLLGTPFGDRTIGQLLSHGAGLAAESPTEWWERVPGQPWESFATSLSIDDVKHPAGRRFHYSNLGYGLLGEILARLNERTWEQVVRDDLLLPLGMVRTTMRPESPAAQGFSVHPWADLVLREPEHDGAAMAAAGQLWSTLTDLGRLATFLLGDTGDVLASDTLAEMCAPAGVDAAAPGWSAYGLGLQVHRVDGHIHVGHGGSMPGFLASVFVDREDGIGGVLLTNGTSGLAPGAVDGLITILRDSEPPAVQAWQPLDHVDEDALALTGTWYWGTSTYGLRLCSDGLLHLFGLLGAGRASRFRRTEAGWIGLEGYHAGELLRPVMSEDRVVALDLGSFVFSRTPYDPAAPIPGGVDPTGWTTG